MIKPKSIGAVVLGVRDVNKSMAWYREKFGFERLYDDCPNSSAIAIGGNGVEILLNPLDDPHSATSVDPSQQACIQLLCLQVEEVELERVAEVFPEDKCIVVLDGHPRYRSRIVEDPDGNAIELYAEK